MLNDWERLNLVRQHAFDGLGHETICADGHREVRHDLSHRQTCEQIADFMDGETGSWRWQDEADIAVADDADEPPVLEYGKVPNVVALHECPRLVHWGIWGHRERSRGHKVSYSPVPLLRFHKIVSVELGRFHWLTPY
jgi:hypothetical protein